MDSPATRLIDLAIRVQETGGGLSLDDEIRRYNRMIRNSWRANWNCPPFTTAALLDFIGVVISSPEFLASRPRTFDEKISRAAGGMDPAEYVHMLAGMVRILDREPPAQYDELPMSRWELSATFPHLDGFTAEMMDGGHASFADAVTSYVTNEHPDCADVAVAITTEAQRALVLFPDEQSLGRYVSWISRQRLHALLETVNDHMQREHS
ncbi:MULTISPECIES: hypothetical protein [Streptomyces]|uniref:hypothetical protein n=1 Tax=Streptomyces TaxID=1883 RepID=UPI0013317583|nr:hypothetical protein [Streptomyces sp. Sge12]